MFSTRDCRSVDAAAAQLVVREAGGVVSFGERAGRRAAGPRRPLRRSPPRAPTPTCDCCSRPRRRSRERPRHPKSARHRRLGARRAHRARPRRRRSPLARAPRTSCAPSPSAPRSSFAGTRACGPRGQLPAAELIGRDEWARVEPRLLPRACPAEVEEKLAERMQRVGQLGGRLASASPAPRRAPRSASPLGYLAQRVVGQYDVALIGPAREPRLLFVGAQPLGRTRAPGRRPRACSCAGSPCTRPRTRSSSPRCPGCATTWAGSPRSCSQSAAVEIKPGELLGKLAAPEPARAASRSVDRRASSPPCCWTEPQRRLVDR